MRSITPDLFEGCLLGQCLGDAVGLLVEGRPPIVCKNYIGLLNQLRAEQEWGPFGSMTGQYSDDSQLAREMMQSFLDAEGFDPRAYAARIAAIFSEDRIVGRGRTTEKAAKQLANGAHWTDSGVPAPAAGNGSAMRAAPMGLMYYWSTDRLVAYSRNQSYITHKATECLAGSAAIAAAAAYALTHDDIAVPEFITFVADAAAVCSNKFAYKIKLLGTLKDLTPGDAYKSISSSAKGSSQYLEWQGISPYVVPSVLWSLYSFIKDPEDYWKAISTAIAVGGDVDTTAAMTGAISGAHLGLGQLPDLVTKVNDQGTWGYEKLRKLAQDCFALKERIEHNGQL